MNSGLIKTLGLSILLTLVLIIVVNVIGDFAVRPKPGYSPEKVASQQNEAKKPEAETSPPAAVVNDLTLPALLASVDPEKSKKSFRKCKGCHSSEENARKLIGPNLWNVVGRAKASQDGYKYSKAMSELGGEWSYEDLDTFLSDPRGYAKGTKMMFKGIRTPAGRAMVIAYLRALSDSPKPLPE